MAYIKYSRTLSGGVSVQVATSRGRSTQIVKHFGTAHDDLTLGALIDQAEEFLGLGAQMSLDIGVDAPARPRPSMADTSNYHERVAGDKQLELAVDSAQVAPPASSPEGQVAVPPSTPSPSPRVVDTPARLTWDARSTGHIKAHIPHHKDDHAKARGIS